MQGKAKNKKTPSRERYEEKHPTISFRLDNDTRKCLKEHLASTGCSFADFVKDALGREESMIEKRVKMQASRRVAPSDEDKLRCLEDLVHQLLIAVVTTDEYPPSCPYCDNHDLCECMGREKESTQAHPWVPTWKCPKCGYFIDTLKRIDPESIKWVDPDSGKYSDKPKTSSRNRLKKRR